jgi:FAD/FMN-containing dehydrogenase
MTTTLGGCLGMNIHGKNAYAVGPIGDHVRGLRILTVAGQILDITPQSDPTLFHAVISGAGELAIILQVELQLKRIYSGRMEIYAECGKNLDELFAIFAQHEASSDYLVGWVDAFASGNQLGRGLIHVAWQFKKDTDPAGQALLRPEAQTLPSRLFGVIPKSQMWRLIKPFTNRWGMRLVNLAKYWSSRLLEHRKRYQQTHGGFHFLLDYVPGWKRVYEPGGLIQHQIFVPKDKAREVFAQVLELQQSRGLETYLAVMKRHRADPFLLTHGLDGYSLAQDFAVTSSNRQQIWALCHEMDQIVLAAGGRFYFAKDATLQPETVRQFLGDAALQQFAGLRQQYDPDGVLATDLYDRALGPALTQARQSKA